MKVHLRVFVEVENLGKIMNILSDSGVTGFYIVEYKGISPQEWQGFSIKEDPASAISVIHDSARDAILVCSVVDEEKVDNIISEVSKSLKNERYTIVEVPIRRIIVNSPKEV
ncbi:MJ1244 family protein [Methanobacterium alcaliphilum]|uniref:MJ1244 family protein n=1 Tax=Methanobacterium alcaliphilum TaxID=392018 RepID=UPI00200A1EA7|nr:MJ1244 family protein [Methanobacterium alcaliphilum]MCK9150559.1 MJ1244 family protein [Methanobacterium alcaliphilum]